tara:strand:- start:354 stop:740 length:387 start_codon:yes stop_codon:yes gene_type:complete
VLTLKLELVVFRDREMMVVEVHRVGVNRVAGQGMAGRAGRGNGRGCSRQLTRGRLPPMGPSVDWLRDGRYLIREARRESSPGRSRGGMEGNGVGEGAWAGNSTVDGSGSRSSCRKGMRMWSVKSRDGR